MESLADFGKTFKNNVSEIVDKEKARVQYSFEHTKKQMEHSSESSR